MTSGRELSEIVQVSPEVMSGVPAFRGTRVPVLTLLDHLEAGDSLDAFLADFPTVRREPAIQFLELAGFHSRSEVSSRVPTEWKLDEIEADIRAIEADSLRMLSEVTCTAGE